MGSSNVEKDTLHFVYNLLITMGTVELKKRIQSFVDKANDRVFLKLKHLL